MSKNYPTPCIVHIKSQVPIVLSVLKRHSQAVTVLFYPGTMATPAMYPELLIALYNYGCNVVAISPLAHGKSSKNKKSFVFDDILQNGLDAQNWVKDNFSGPIVICGHSQGGILALAHSMNNNDISACFPICTLLMHREDSIEVTHFKSLRAYRNKILKILKKLSYIMPRLPIPFFAYLSIKNVIANAYKVNAPRGECRSTYPLSFLYSLFVKDLSSKNGKISCPVFLITAKDDMLFPLKMMNDTLDEIEAVQKKLIIIEAGGHLAATSKYYAKHIAAYIAEHCAGLGLPLYITKKHAE